MKNAASFALILVGGALIGSFLGKFLAIAFPSGVIHDMFAWEQSFGLAPAVLDLRILNLTLGLQLRVSGTTLLGVLASALLYKKLA